MKATSVCNEKRLHVLLEADEQSDEYRRAAQHLESCGNCQAKLSELAGNDEDWRNVRELLVPPADSVLTNAPGPCSSEPQAAGWRTQGWADSLARQVLESPRHPEMLGRLGRYDVERLIGSGGMGVVFKAFDTQLHRPVAIKVLAPYLAGNGAARKRFAREARAAAAVVHEHVVAIHNVETGGEAPFLVMPLVAGESLQQRIDREGPLELRELLRIAMQTASGLAAAHAQGLVHRDVKPANILLEHGVERALLTDFGLARASDEASLTHTGYHPGTPQYMSPEQACGERVDARSDLFSLGSVMYAMATGRPPFRADTSYGILRKITDSEPRRLREVNSEMPEWLEYVVHWLLAKSPDGRPQSAEHVERLLRSALAHVQQPTSVPLPTECCPPRRSSRWQTRNAFLPAACLGLAILVGLASTWNALRSPATSSADEAAAESAPQNDTAPTTAWGTSAGEIEAFDRELAEFEQRAGPLWAELPSTSPSTKPLTSTLR